MPNLQKFYSRYLWRAAPTHFVLLGIVLAIALFIYTPQAPNVDNSVSAVETSPDIELAQKVAKEIIAACPIVKDAKNLAAFNSCAQAGDQALAYEGEKITSGIKLTPTKVVVCLGVFRGDRNS